MSRILSNSKLLIYLLRFTLILNLDNILNFDEEFESEMHFSLKKLFKTFNCGELKADLLTIVYVEHSVYVVFVMSTENKKCTVS